MGPAAFDLSLYLVTDSTLLPPGVSLISQVEAAIRGGVTIVQLREKKIDTREFVTLAQSLIPICRSHGVPLLINDRLDVALATGADGVHVGQSDMPVRIVRRLLGPDKIVGVTAETPEDALDAIAGGADYLGSRAVFSTATKPESKPIGVEGVRGILEAVESSPRPIPVVAIGGIAASNASQVLTEAVTQKGTNIAGLAVVSAIIAKPDAEKAAWELKGHLIDHRKRSPSANPSLAVRVPADVKPNVDIVDKVIVALKLIRERTPLVHNITNFVAMNDSANILLHIGGSPIMAHDTNEAAAIVSFCGALVLNIGTLYPPFIEGMKVAAAKASTLSTPIVLDPVGVGATSHRMQTALTLLNDYKVTILRGNGGEIAAIAGQQGAQSRGVDSVGAVESPEKIVQGLAKQKGVVVAMTGKPDYVSDGRRLARVHNKSRYLPMITASGCMVAALTGAFAAVCKDDPFVAAVGALVAMGVASEMAESGHSGPHPLKVNGPGTFRIALFDAISHLDGDTIKRTARVDFEILE